MAQDCYNLALALYLALIIIIILTHTLTHSWESAPVVHFKEPARRTGLFTPDTSLDSSTSCCWSTIMVFLPQ